ncbi:hypothetical protein ACFSCX_06585 [Bacillus salitolerans]|uniref:Uncharacterized protein n=1 Tax=Bacillus salitolerans TaxID=1437434 RepID=A0ABW4LM25_9BACI
MNKIIMLTVRTLFEIGIPLLFIVSIHSYDEFARPLAIIWPIYTILSAIPNVLYLASTVMMERLWYYERTLLVSKLVLLVFSIIVLIQNW